MNFIGDINKEAVASDEDIKKQLLQDLAKWLSSLGLERYLTAANHWCCEIMGAIDVDEFAPYKHTLPWSYRPAGPF